MTDDHYRRTKAWLDQVFADRELSGGPLRVGYQLASKFNRKKGYAWPSHKWLADATKMGVRGVQKSAGRLEDRGHLVIKTGAGPGGTNTYTPVLKKDELPFAGGTNPGSENRRTSVRTEETESKKLREIYPPKTGKTSVLFNENKPPGFDEFWRQYPRKVEKKATVKAYAKALREGASPDDIIAAVCRYAAERVGEPVRYTKHPATWLNAGCWDDEPAVQEFDTHFEESETRDLTDALTLIANAE